MRVFSYGMVAKSSVTFFGQRQRPHGIEAIANLKANARRSKKGIGEVVLLAHAASCRKTKQGAGSELIAAPCSETAFAQTLAVGFAF